MSAPASLQSLLSASAAEHGARTAVSEPAGGALTYGELDRLSDDLRDRLVHVGVVPGDRVGLYLRKSLDSLVGIFGILKAGAAYVPVDADAPAERGAFILDNCAVRVVITDESLARTLRPALEKLQARPRLLSIDRSGADPVPIRELLLRLQRQEPAAPTTTVDSTAGSLAYILYTSGSTGSPKGVMLTQRAALTFVDWCSATFAPSSEDVFSSHAPLHFDLSILDVYVPLKHGARLVLIGEDLGKDPMRLAPVIGRERISVWYSTPSILSLLASHGKLERYDYGSLRLVLFAGEVFPIPRLRAVKRLWPGPRYFNLYGPTETNVCTYHELPPEIEAERTQPYPIGRVCVPLAGRVIDVDGEVAPAGAVGELVVSGPSVMAGYWNLPDQTERAFLVEDGVSWYRTGDLVVEESDGVYCYHGRRDRMVKRRGYRVELGEIETGLSRHPDVCEVAVIAQGGRDADLRIKAILGLGHGGRLPLIELKRFATTHLPRYMVPDVFAFVEVLPRTSTNKIDYQALEQST